MVQLKYRIHFTLFSGKLSGLLVQSLVRVVTCLPSPLCCTGIWSGICSYVDCSIFLSLAQRRCFPNLVIMFVWLHPPFVFLVTKSCSHNYLYSSREPFGFKVNESQTTWGGNLPLAWHSWDYSTWKDPFTSSRSERRIFGLICYCMEQRTSF